MTSTQFQKLALSFPETSEEPHFEKISFRVNKKIFATLDVKGKLATIKLSEIDQDVFSKFDPSAVFPVPNKWGKQGWTHINLQKVNPALCADALAQAWTLIAPKKLHDKISAKK